LGPYGGKISRTKPQALITRQTRSLKRAVRENICRRSKGKKGGGQKSQKGTDAVKKRGRLKEGKAGF